MSVIETSSEPRAEARTPKALRVAICTTGGDRFEGIERFVLTCAEYLRRGSEVEPWVFLFQEGLLATRLRASGVPVVVFPARWKYDPTLIREIKRTLVRNGIDLVHTHGYKATILFGAAARRCGIRVVKTEHGAPERRHFWDQTKMAINSSLEKLATRRWVDRVVYVSRELQSRLPRTSNGIVIYNGLDAASVGAEARPADLEVDESSFHIAIIGRLVPVKGHHLLLDALLHCRNRERIRLHIFGTGPLDAELRQRIETAGLGERVRMHGFKPNITEYIRHVDAVAMPSLHEALPYTLLETMLLRRPVVASRVGGLAEVLEHDVTGLLVEPGQPIEFARSIDRLVEDRGLRERLATRAYQRATADFTAREMAARYVALYRDTVDGLARRPIEWMTWHASRRTMELARALQIPVRLIARGRLPGSGRALAFARSLGRLLVTDARVLLLQNPSVLLTSLACLLRPRKRYRLVQDLHSCFYETVDRPRGIRDRVYGALSRYCVARTDLTIVTNPFLAQLVERLGGRAFVLQDRFPEFPRPGRVTLPGTRNVAFICTYSDDEPVEEVLRAARRLPSGVVLHMTGRPPKRSRAWQIPDNVRLTGYLAEPRYVELLNSVDLVLVLTTRPHTLLCGAYEGIALGKPLVMSDQAALRDYFRRGVVFTANEAEAIADSIAAALGDMPRLQREVVALKRELSTVWQARLRTLEKLIADVASS